MTRTLLETQTPSVLRRPAQTVSAGMVVLAMFLVVAPWQQTASGVGRLVAFSPTDRPQTVEAPVKGRIVKWHVVEGSVVKAGDPIVEIVDVDPSYISRLQQERDAIESRRVAAEAQAAAYEQQAEAYEQVRIMAIRAAERKIEMTTQKLRGAEAKVVAERAALETAKLNGTRVRRLAEEGLSSSRDAELTDLTVAKAENAVGVAEATRAEAEAARIGMQAERMVKESEALAKIASARAAAQKAAADAAKARGELAKIDVFLSRQDSRKVTAPQDGIVLELSAGFGSEIVKEGDALAVIVPKMAAKAVEIWIDGNDMPLVQVDRPVRLQFEGWPAVQFAGWPSVAVGTFGGRVALVDAQSRKGGAFRVLVVPDPNDEEWPEDRFLRQGVQAKAWVLLDEVRIGYELWRRANGFPATVTPPPPEEKVKK